MKIHEENKVQRERRQERKFVSLSKMENQEKQCGKSKDKNTAAELKHINIFYKSEIISFQWRHSLSYLCLMRRSPVRKAEHFLSYIPHVS